MTERVRPGDAVRVGQGTAQERAASAEAYRWSDLVLGGDRACLPWHLRLDGNGRSRPATFGELLKACRDSGIAVQVGSLPQGQNAEVDFDTATITLAPGLTETSARSALVHEIVHLERGSFDAADEEAEERRVEEETVRRLIPDSVLSRGLWRMAEELGVYPSTIVDRVRGLSDDEVKAGFRWGDW